MKQQRLFIAFIFLFVLIACIGVEACPQCKDAYVAGSKEASIGESYSYSVVFFLGMFFSLLFGGTAFISWKIKTAMRLKAQTPSIENH